MPETETLEDHLRRVTRNFSSRLSEDEVFALGCQLARELVRAHGETPPRHPALEPSAISIVAGEPRLDGVSQAGSVAEDIFLLGALLYGLATGSRPDVSWRLDAPPSPALSSLARRATLSGLLAPRRADRFASAQEALAALESARAPSVEEGSRWTVFRGDAARRGAAPGADAARFVPEWNARIGAVESSPVLTGTMVLAATGDGRLVFLDRKSGRSLHELRLGTAIESTPAISAGILHVGTDDGDLVGVDVAQGTERYRVKLGQLVRSSPLVVGNRLFVGVVLSKTAGLFMAADPAQGPTSWSRKLGAVFSSPAHAATRVLVGSDDGSLYAFHPDTGAPVWSAALGGKVRATPAVTEELAVVGSFAGRLAGVRLESGTPAWTAELGHPIYSSACLAGGLAVVGCNEGHVHGVNLATGAPAFQAQTRGPVISSAVASGGSFLVGSTDGSLYLLASDGRILHSAALSSSQIHSSPAVDQEQVFVGSADGLHALRLVP